MGERDALDSDDDFDNDTKRKDDNDDAEAEAALQKLLGFFGRLDRAAAAAAEEREEAKSDLVTGASNESIIAPAQTDFSIASVATQEADLAPEVVVPEGSKDHQNLAPSSAEVPKDRPKQVENVDESAKEEDHKDFDQAIDKSSSIDTHKQRRTEEPIQVTTESPRPESDKHINKETAESPTSQTLANVLNDKAGSPKPKIRETSHRGEPAENQTQKPNEERSSASESLKHEEVLEAKDGLHDNAVKETSTKDAPLSPNVQKTSAAAPKFKPTMLVETLDESDLENERSNSEDERHVEDDNDDVLSDGEHQVKAVSPVVSPGVSGTSINPLYNKREANVSSNKLAAGRVPKDAPHFQQKPPSLLSQRSLSSNTSSSSAQSVSQESLFKQELEKANCATTQNSMQSHPFPQTPPLIQTDAPEPVAKQEPMTPQASNVRAPNEVSMSAAQAAQGFYTPTSKLHLSTKSLEPESPLLSVSQRTYRSAGENLWENVDHDDRISTFSLRHVVAARKPAKRDETSYPEWLETVELLAHKLPNKGPLRRTALIISAVTYASLSTSTLASFANAPKDIIEAKVPVGVMPAVHRELTRFFLNFTFEERHRVRELCLVPGMTFGVARALVKTYGVEVMNSTETPASLSAMLEVSSLQRMGMLAALMDGRLCRGSQHQQQHQQHQQYQQHQQHQRLKEEKVNSAHQLKVSGMSPSQPADCPRQPEKKEDHPKAFPMPTSQRESASSHFSHPESKEFDVLHVEVPEIWQGMYERVLVTVGNKLVSLTEVVSQVPEFFALETSGPLRVQRKVGVIEERNVSGQSVEMRRMIGIRKSAQPQQHIVVDILVVHERLAVKDAAGDQGVQSQGQPTNGLLTDLMKLYFRSHAKQASADSRSAAAQALGALQDQLQVRFPDALGTLRQFLALEGQAESTSSASSPAGKSVLGKRQRLL